MSSRQPGLTILIPAFNESEGISNALSEVAKWVSHLGTSWELLVIDDCSADQTPMILKELTNELPYLRAFRLRNHGGKEYAVARGLTLARGERVLIMDADLQHPPSLIPRLWELMLKENLDIAEGRKQEEPDLSLLHQAFCHLYYLALGLILSKDMQGASDFKILGPEAVSKLRTVPPERFFLRGLCAISGLRTGRLDFRTSPRLLGRSGWSNLALVTLAGSTLFSFLLWRLRLKRFIRDEQGKGLPCIAATPEEASDGYWL